MSETGTSLPGRQLFEELQLHPNLRFHIGDHIVDAGALRIADRPELPRLSGKAMAVLIELVRHSGATVTREQLLQRVWRKADHVVPDVLVQAVVELRRAFLDSPRAPRYIETVPRVGYRLIAPVSLLRGETPPFAARAALGPAIGRQ